MSEPTNLLTDVLSFFQPVQDYLSDYPYVKALTILLVALMLARLSVVIVGRVMGTIAAKTRVNWDDMAVLLLRRPVFWSVVLGGGLLALLPLGLPKLALGVAQSIVVSLLIFLWSGFVLRMTRIALRAMSANAQENAMVRPQTRPLFENLSVIVVLVLAIYFIFQAWNIDMTAWLASAGIIGIAIGFAAKDTLANLFSGVFILADAPYKIGDYVVLDSGERGKVTHIGIRSTRLLTRDDVEVTIPNAIMGNTRVKNESGGPHVKHRIRVKVGVAYGTDIDKVRAILEQIAAEDMYVCEDPEPRVRFRSFGASGLDFELLGWIDDPELRGRALDALNTTVYKQFMAEGIEIPYSKHDLYIKEAP